MTQLELDMFVTNSQCCATRKASLYIQAKNNGDFDWQKQYYEWLLLITLISSIQDYDYTNGTCFTEDEICYIVEMIKRLCNDCGC